MSSAGVVAAGSAKPRRAAARPEDATVEWLLASPEPAVRWLARTQVLGLGDDDRETRRDHDAVVDGTIVRTLLTYEDGLERPRHPYTKWTGAHWRLVSLVELGIPHGESAALAQYPRVLDWLLGAGHLRGVAVIDGRARRCASQEGNALAVGVRLGLADDPRVRELAQNLVKWQWPDGGWNCDRRPRANHSSFHESISPMWGLVEYADATGDRNARWAASRGLELLLVHEVFKSHRTGKAMHPSVVVAHWPPYWHYDYLRGLTILRRAGGLSDPRTKDALELLLNAREPDGTWRAGRRWWTPPGRNGSGVEAVDWGANETEDRLLTIYALGALHAAGVSTSVT